MLASMLSSSPKSGAGMLIIPFPDDFGFAPPPTLPPIMLAIMSASMLNSGSFVVDYAGWGATDLPID